MSKVVSSLKHIEDLEDSKTTHQDMRPKEQSIRDDSRGPAAPRLRDTVRATRHTSCQAAPSKTVESMFCSIVEGGWDA